MTEYEEKRHYFGALVEDLYRRIKIIEEDSNTSDREKRNAQSKLVYDFYNEYKIRFELENIETVMIKLEKLKQHEKMSQEEQR